MRQYGETGRRRLTRGRRVRKERLGVCGQADMDVKEGEGVSKTRGGVARGGGVPHVAQVMLCGSQKGNHGGRTSTVKDDHQENRKYCPDSVS